MSQARVAVSFVCPTILNFNGYAPGGSHEFLDAVAGVKECLLGDKLSGRHQCASAVT